MMSVGLNFIGGLAALVILAIVAAISRRR
jgi:hypothetical protein